MAVRQELGSTMEIVDKYFGVLGDYGTELTQAKRFAEADAYIDQINNEFDPRTGRMVSRIGRGIIFKRRPGGDLDAYEPYCSAEVMPSVSFLGNRLVRVTVSLDEDDPMRTEARDLNDQELVLADTEAEFGVNVRGLGIFTVDDMVELGVRAGHERLLEVAAQTPAGGHMSWIRV